MTPARSTVVAALLYAGMVFAWAFNYLAVRWGLEFAAPLLLASLRAVVGAIVVYLGLTWRGGLGRLDANDRRDAALIGVPTTAVFYGLWFTAAGSVPPGVASVLVYTFPLWVTLLSAPVLGTATRPRELVAIAAGFAGVALAAEPWQASGVPVIPAFELVGGAAAWALGTVLFKRRFSGGKVQEANFYQLAGGSIGLAFATGATASFRIEPTVSLLLVVLWVGIVGTAFGYATWFFLLNKFAASTVSSFLFLVPVTALLLSAALLGERLNLLQVAGVGLVVASIVATAGALSRSPERPVGTGARPGEEAAG
ncbi:MAG: EamA family transporter [Thermoplasmata archaeon]|nr:EamA family transporter [Thermoplasmata archaeon]